MERNKKYLLFIVLCLAVLPVALALLDSEQTSGARSFTFYYGCLASQCGVSNQVSHRWATQSFLINEIEQITSIQLKLRKISSSIWDPCLYDDMFRVEIRDSVGRSLALSENIPICDLSSSFDWFEITFDEPVDVTPGETHKIVVLYRGSSLRHSPNMAWQRATFDAYPEGVFRFNANGRNRAIPYDATFRVYGRE